MKKKYLVPVLGLFSIGVLSFNSSNAKIETFKNFSHQLNSSGSQFGMTGAPGEGTCVSCHSSTVIVGGNENVLTVLSGINPVTSYIPGQTYTVSLTMSSNPAKKGFNATALGSGNQMAGTFAANSGTDIKTSGSKKYATHTSASNTSTTMTWLWNWTAPATDVGNVTFYVASNKANGNNNQAGDQIYTSQHVINSTLGLAEEQVDHTFNAAYNASENRLHISCNALQANEMYVNLLDASGKSVYFASLGETMIGEVKESIQLPSLKNGTYFVHFFIGNKGYLKQIAVVK